MKVAFNYFFRPISRLLITNETGIRAYCKMRLVVSVIIISVTFSSCIKEYWPGFDPTYDEILVVDGHISNTPVPYVVNLSYSSGIDDIEIMPYTGCIVKIIEDTGIEELLIEMEPGVYQSSISGMNGKIGHSYKIYISTKDEKVYESNYQKLLPPVEINNIKTQIEFHDDNNYTYQLAGVQFYITTAESDSDTAYFIWQLKGTYKYRSDFLIKYIFDNRKWSVFPHPDSLYTCFYSYVVPGIYTGKTENLSKPQIVDFPLNFVSTETRALSMRYSLLVDQLRVNKDAYEFYERIKSVNAEVNYLSYQQPYQVRGNIYNLADEDELVLGYFYATGVDSKRIYIDRSNDLPYRYGICELDAADFEAYGQAYWSSSNYWPIYGVESDEGRKAAPDKACSDCRKLGGEIQQPDFWLDK